MNENWPPEPENLDKELAIYLEDLPPLGKCLRHPLVYAVPYFEPLNQTYNKSLQYKKNALNKALDDKNWPSYLFMHERPYRIEAFKRIKDLMDNKDYWENLIWVYIDLEFHYTHRSDLKKFFTDPERSNSYENSWLMSPEELKVFNNFPKIVSIYRGVGNHKSKLGMSWTLDQEKAMWFARRFNDKPILLTATVKSEHIIAYLASRNEQEVIILPEFVENVNAQKISGRK